MANVMVVDDSFMMRTLISDIVKSDPHLKVVAEASNGQEALDQIRKLDPDVILLDIEMPKMDGLEAAKRLRLMSKAKVVIISSVAMAGSPQAMEARKLGVFAVIPKPSGAMSLDIKEKSGHEIVQTIRRAVGLTG